MKTTTFIKSIALIAVFSFISCSKDDTTSDSGKLTSDDVSVNAKMDAISNDITEIAEDQLAQQSETRMNNFSHFPDYPHEHTGLTRKTRTKHVKL